MDIISLRDLSNEELNRLAKRIDEEKYRRWVKREESATNTTDEVIKYGPGMILDNPYVTDDIRAKAGEALAWIIKLRNNGR